MKSTHLFTATIALLSACSPPEDARTPRDAAATDSGGRYAPQTDAESALLERAAQIPAGAKETVDGQTLSASEPYVAASGFTCRRLFLQAEEKREVRLACGDEQGWFFVPDVHRAEQAVAAQPRAEVKLSPQGAATAVEPTTSEAAPPRASGDATQKAGP